MSWLTDDKSLIFVIFYYILLFMLLQLSPLFPLCPPPPISPPTGNPHAVVHVHGSWILTHVLWLIPSPSFTQCPSPCSPLIAVSLFHGPMSLFLLCSLVYFVIRFHMWDHKCLNKNLHTHVHSSSTFRSQSAEPTTGPSKDEWASHMQYIHTLGYHSAVKRKNML